MKLGFNLLLKIFLEKREVNLGFFEPSVLCFTLQWYKLLESHGLGYEDCDIAVCLTVFFFFLKFNHALKFL